MSIPLLIGLAENLLFLLAVVFVYDLVANGRTMGGRAWKQVGVGLVIGLLVVGTMAASWQYAPGLQFDARSVVLGMTGLFFGTLATVPAMLMAVAYRVSQGGTGMLTGVLVIASSGTVGLLWRHLRGGVDHRMHWRELYAFGIVVHLAYLVLMLTLPEGRGFELLPLLAAPVLGLYPLAMLLLGMLLVRRMGRERDAERLAEDEARYRVLFEDSPSVMLLMDPEHGRIVGANRAAADFYGYSLETLRGKPLTEICELPEAGIREALALAVAGERSTLDLRHVLADGSVREVEVHSGPIPIEGRILLHSVVRDVTAQRDAEEALRKQGELLRLRSAALEAAANPIVITDRQGEIEWVNPAFTRLTGYSEAEAVGRAPGEVIGSGEHGPGFFQELWARIRAGEVWEGEMVNRKKDGTIYREQQTITPVRNAAGEIAHFIAIKRDLTERLALQAQLLQAQKMEAVGQFAEGIAHDFNNLLTIMNGSAQLGVEMSEPFSKIRQEFDQILEAGRRSSSLTQQILTFGRQGPTKRSVVDLNGVLRQSTGLLKRLTPDSVRFESDLCEGVLPVLCDPNRIEQVLLNLAVNARDAMPQGGHLTFRTRLEHTPAPRGPRPQVILTVIDTGTGMAPEVQARIFDPFFTTKEVGKGTGLGLATVYGIVTQAEGEITVESSPGRGTTFRIALPLASERNAAMNPVPPQSGTTGNGARRNGSENGASAPRTSGARRILLVEDDAAIRRVASRILEREGFEVIAAASGEDALRALEAEPDAVDLVLTDVVMPEMTGPQLVDRIRSRSPEIHVLFSSGHSGEALADHGLDLEKHTFLSKPYSVDGLTSRVREALGED
ncbi:MAG: PAS domain S-box protein [Gemmatimonadota bacterium]